VSRHGQSRPSRPSEVKRGQVWVVTFEPANVGSEIGKERPAVVISNDTVNAAPIRRSTVIPISTKDFQNPLHIQVIPPEGGLNETGYVVCDYQRTVSHERLLKYLGMLDPETTMKIGRMLKKTFSITEGPPNFLYR